MENLVKDLRYGARTLLRQPAFTAVAVLSLALGIGLDTTIFSVVNAVLFRPLAVAEPDRLVEVYSSPSAEYPHLTSSYPDFRDLETGVDAFSGLAAHALVRGIFNHEGRNELVLGEVASAGYFDLVGARITLGRGFLPEEDRTAGTHPVLVLSHGCWQRRLAGDPDVLGRTVKLSGLDYAVVGVTAPEFTGTIPGLEPEFWTPTTMVGRLSFSGIQNVVGQAEGRSRLEHRGTRWLFVTGRLAPGRSLEEARAQVETVMARLAADHPETNEDVRATLLPTSAVRLHPMVDGLLAPAAAVLLGAVGLVLLIACANVASMLLARASARRREIAVRLAIGASRGRLVRQLLTESLVLAALGGAAGVLIAHWCTRLLAAFQPALPIPLHFGFELDWRVLGFAVLASLATAVLFGLAPAFRASRPDLVPALKNEVPVGAGRRRLDFKSALVVGQLAVSMVLLVAGSLLIRGLQQASRIDPGFEPERLAMVEFNLQMNGYTLEQAVAFQKRAVERVAALPGVEAVAIADRLPLAPDINMEGVHVPGHHQPDDEPTPIDATWVEPDYFRALGVPLLEGRLLTEADDPDAPPVVVINEAMARSYWPDRSPLGERLYSEGFEGPAVEVVGVVRDYKVRTLGEEPRPYLHFARRQQPSRITTLLVRTPGDAVRAVPELRRAILELEPGIVFSSQGTVGDLLHMTLAPTRVGAALLGSFGALALVLAAVGLYGVIAHSVVRCTREVGLRMALGAPPRAVLALVIRQGMMLALVGVALGLAGALGASRLLSSLLYGVGPLDPLAIAAAAALLLSIALAANTLPARRAARVDPMVALRYE